MKRQILAFVSAIVVAFMIVTTIPAGAQIQEQPKDSIVISGDSASKPIFKGNEKTTVDSLKAVKAAVADSEINSLVGSAITALNNKPTDGASTSTYIGWGITSLITAFLGFITVRNKLTKKPDK